jgi:hypothetical protein
VVLVVVLVLIVLATQEEFQHFLEFLLEEAAAEVRLVVLALPTLH